jgi:translation initiation factor IF-3
VLDYSKYKYELAQKQKAARKHQQQITIREIKFRPKIAQADYDTKKGHVQRFLLGKDKVKVTIMFRGREVTHPERGVALLDKLAGELGEIAVIEQSPLQDGRNMTMMLAPSKAVLAQESHEHEHNGEAAPAKSSRRDRAAAAHASENGSFVRPEPDPEEDTDDEMEPETAEE